MFRTETYGPLPIEELDESERAITLLMDAISRDGSQIPGVDTESVLAQIRPAMQEYNIAMERQLRGWTEELKAMLTLFGKTLLHVSTWSEIAAPKLEASLAGLDSLSQLEDLHLLHTQFEETLHLLMDEHSHYNALQAGMGSGPHQDTVTGLQERLAAEEYLTRVSRDCSNTFMAGFIVERVDMFNERYGDAVGDQILQLFAHKLAAALAPQDRIFRWRGDVFVAVLQRNDRIEQVHSDLQRSTNTFRSEHLISLQSRSVILPVSAISILIPVPETISPQAAVAALDEFIKTKTSTGGRN